MKIKWTVETKAGRILSTGVTSTVSGWREHQRLIKQGYDIKPRLNVMILKEAI
jgi:hypothetical protein